MNCPRCQSAITQSFDPDSIIVCPGCGARLMTRAAALRSQGKLKPSDPVPTPLPPPDEEALSEVAGAGPSGPPAEAPAGSSEPDLFPLLGRPAPADPPQDSTLPPTPEMLASAGAPGFPASVIAGAPGPTTMELLLRELQLLRTTQGEILDLLRRGEGPPAVRPREPEPEATSVLQPVRSRRRKTVLLIDDDPETRDAAIAELGQADVPVRSAAEGNEALRMIADDKPDVIALELALEGEMAGKDMINLIKATMEWVDIPVVLWTREPVTTQKEARLVHGADEVVQKKTGPAALATRVITLFRRA